MASFTPEAITRAKIRYLLFWLGNIMNGLMSDPSNRQYEGLLRTTDKFVRAAVEFHNSDTGAQFYMPMPLTMALPPSEARHNTREGRAGLGFMLEWHRQQLVNRRDV